MKKKLYTGNRVVVGFWGLGECTNQDGTVVSDQQQRVDGKMWTRVHLDSEAWPRWVPTRVLDVINGQGQIV